MRAGRLRHRITIQEPASTVGGLGEKLKSWADVATVWAAIEPLRGREFFESHQRESEATTVITIRYRSGLTHSMRINFGSKYYKIDDILNPDERNRYLEIIAIDTEDFN